MWTPHYQPIIDHTDPRKPQLVAWEALARWHNQPPNTANSPIPNIAIYQAAANSRPDSRPLHLNLHPDDIIDLTHDIIDLNNRHPNLVWELIETGTGCGDHIARLGPDIALALDDLGAGNEDILRIVRVPAQCAKIDIAVTHAAAASNRAAAMLEGLTRFLTEQGITVIAEGVETPEHLAAITSAGIKQSQGWLWAPAMPAHEALKWQPEHPRAA